MANLSLRREVRYVPNIPGNRELPEAEQISFSITAGLTTVEMAAFNRDALAAAHLPLADGATPEQAAEHIARQNAALAAVVGAFVRVNPSNTTLEGVNIATVLDYFNALDQRPGGWLLTGELVSEVRRVNSLEGERALFSVRSSGGTTSTR